MRMISITLGEVGGILVATIAIRIGNESTGGMAAVETGASITSHQGFYCAGIIDPKAT